MFFITVKDRSEFTTFLNKINREHMDFFILCGKITMKPFCVTEIVVTSNQRKDQKESRIYHKLYKYAGLPLCRCPDKYAYVLN